MFSYNIQGKYWTILEKKVAPIILVYVQNVWVTTTRQPASKRLITKMKTQNQCKGIREKEGGSNMDQI